MTSIAERLADVRLRVERAASAARRDPGSVQLIAVSKRMTIEAIRETYAAGQRDFGENYAQELVAKADKLTDLADLRWHMIGHLQRNKVKLIAGRLYAMHSVDSARLAEALEQRWAPNGPRLRVFIEVNVSGEASKSGCAPERLEEVARAVATAPHLELRGLMTVPPHTPDPAGALPYFERLRELQREFGTDYPMPDLSIGMSHDLEVAVRAGATHVRIGTAIFGRRPSTGAPPP